MAINPTIKEKIDNATYDQLLSWWRFSPTGNPMFQGDTGEYFSKVMAEKRKKVSDEEHSAISKQIGWG